MGKIFIGTSGYNYVDWKGNFYPEYLDKKDYLTYYSTFFNTVEINFTYYSLPNPFIFKNLLKKVESNFIFSVKAYSSMTHSRDFTQKDIGKFVDSLKPLLDSNKLGCILFQFPWSFRFNKGNFNYLKLIRDGFKSYNLCIEFRNVGWLNPKTFEYLKELDISFCNVDEPYLKGLLMPTDINTNKIGYVRFHGRNVASWWDHKFAYQRYDYLYSRQELLEWVPRIKKIAANTEETYIYFNNHYKAKSAKSAKILMELLEDNNIATSQN